MRRCGCTRRLSQAFARITLCSVMIDPLPAPLPPSDSPGIVPDSTTAIPTPGADPNALTPEEQMARFEKELKETDWGHQPC